MSDSEKPKSWREHRKKIKHKGLVPFVFLLVKYGEWRCEQLSDILERWAFLKVLGHLGRLAVLIAVVFYFTESGNRQKAKHYQAWQVINSSQGKPGSGGSQDALEDLNRDEVSLCGVDVSKAYLSGLNLENAILGRANLSEAYLYEANLAGAVLSNANLSEAELYKTNLAGAVLSGANLTGAELIGANLTEAILMDANLAGARLTGANLVAANFSEANLFGVNLTGANLVGANLTEAILYGANLKDIDWQLIRSIELANIYGVKNPPDGFIEWAKEQGAVSLENRLRRKEQEKTQQK